MKAKAKHPEPKSKRPKFPMQHAMVNGIVAGGMEKMHRKMHGKRKGR